MVPNRPEHGERRRQSELEVGGAGVVAPVDRRAQVVVLLLERVLVRAASASSAKCSRVSCADFVRLAASVESLERVLADGFEHEETPGTLVEEAGAHECGELCARRLADVLGGRGGAPAGEHGQAREQPLLAGASSS